MFHEFVRDDVFRLETRRLWLRWPQAADAPAFAALAGEREALGAAACLPHLGAPRRPDHFIRWSREDNARGAALRLALTLKGGERETVGVVSVETQDGRAMLGYWLGPPYRGRGLAGEAARAATDAFFLFTEAVELGAIAFDAASRGMFEKLGFVEGDGLAAGPRRHAESPASRLVLRRRRWRARGASLPQGPCSVTA